MFKYFKDLLSTLKRIEKHLEKLSSTVSQERLRQSYINTDNKNPKH